MSDNIAPFETDDIKATTIELKEVLAQNNLEEQDLQSYEVNKSRRNRRTHFENVRNSTKTTTRVNRDIQKAFREKRGDFSVADPFDKSFLIVPPPILAMFERAGYKVLFQNYNSDMFKIMVRGGWIPVRLEEVPEFAAAGLPALGNNNALESMYCVSLDQILLKITLDDFENKWQSWMDSKRGQSNQIISRYLENHNSYIHRNFDNVKSLKLEGHQFPSN
jgi:hypothetical protein